MQIKEYPSKIADLAYAWLPAMLWYAFIFALSSSALPMRAAQAHWHYPVKADIPGHLFEFTFLAFFIARAFNLQLRIPKFATLWIAVILTIAFAGAFDEFHQLFVPGRSCALDDWLWDVASSQIGLVGYWVLFSLGFLGDPRNPL